MHSRDSFISPAATTTTTGSNSSSIAQENSALHYAVIEFSRCTTPTTPTTPTTTERSEEVDLLSNSMLQYKMVTVFAIMDEVDFKAFAKEVGAIVVVEVVIS